MPAQPSRFSHSAWAEEEVTGWRIVEKSSDSGHFCFLFGDFNANSSPRSSSGSEEVPPSPQDSKDILRLCLF